MSSANVVQYPLETKRAYKPTSGSSEVITGAQRVAYIQLGTKLFRPQKIQKATFPVNSNYYDDVTFSSYDNLGNLLEQTDKNGIKTSYVWGYGGLYPVAVVQNASSSAVASKVSTPPSMALSTAQDAALRTLSGASVTTYKYEPFVGVTEIKDNSGRVVTYTYDTYGRLSSVKDSDGNLVNKHTYNIAVPNQGNTGPSGTSRNQNFILTNTYTGTGVNDYVADVDYYNGLGDLSQRISVGASPLGRSIVTPVYYDAMRRESRQYLPYATIAAGSAAYDPAAITGANNQKAFYDNIYNGGAFSTVDATYAYTENIYEASPLNRVVAAVNVGSVFRDTANPANDKKTIFTYEANSGSEVMQFRVNSSGALTRATTPFYNANTLYKNRTTNEDGATTTTYTDLLGRVVMERAEDGSTTFDTYYVYDDRGNLCYVLPPKLSALKTSTSAVLTDTNADMKGLAYIYKYDSRTPYSKHRGNTWRD